ncbi:type I polyketide synthase [Boudabousia liubingyangii]|uniref:type I polyketide synthase n=1 Tax=Boudabousia liubingyangii TaxID=1921764 RepID=UPI00094054E5|nr:type I polyketide synthase [Boudabousia liubingyangii]OKL47046.1 type I polyketide synthase [Boudabousia liubingyangii]
MENQNNNRSFPALFAGQAADWQPAWQDAPTQPSWQVARETWEQAQALLVPVTRELVTIAPHATGQIQALFNGENPNLNDADVTVSMPAILLAQIAALAEAQASGLRIDAENSLGHSQGSLAVAAAQAWNRGDRATLAQVVALSVLIANAAQAQVAAAGWPRHQSCMLSSRGLCRNAINSILEKQGQDVQVALQNGSQTFVLSGHPQQLAAFQQVAEKHVQKRNQELADKQRGGTEINPIFEALPVGVPFHHHVLKPALERTLAWAENCQLPADLSRDLATAILVEAHNWPTDLSELAQAHDWVINLGPSDGLTRLSQATVSAQKLQILEAGTRTQREKLANPQELTRALANGEARRAAADYRRFQPQLIALPDGSVRVETAFTRLTGNSPVLLAGMTPTTVDAEIVAAAANAGYWAEMAGGGQYSPEVFNHNLKNLTAQLEPGRCAQFNSMFFDRYMWNLQFGTQKIVSKARAAGAPFNGVTISAGIPEVAEATELLESLAADGFSYVAFKPGTVAQIKAVLEIAAANPERQIIMQVEDGHAGGHHSWENLDDLLSATYPQIRAHENVVLCVGGGIGTPELAARYLLGTWSEQLTGDRRPVDGILVGTAAMTVKEAKTSPQVKTLLRDTPGVDAQDQGGWVGSGQERGGVTSGLSHLHADMYEVANDSAACSRLLSEVGSDMEVIEGRRAEIIAALNRTAKPFFGDLEAMTYLQWVQRFVDLSFPWTDPTWPDRFLDLLHRIEGRLNEADHGQIDTLFPSLAEVEDGPAAVEKLAAAYPQAAEILVNPADAAWFPTLCRKHHKPLPFVPVIDGDLARWWGMDTLWQSQDERYPASAVRVIPGPVSVAGIDRVDEPVAELLGRFEAETVNQLQQQGASATRTYARLGGAREAADFIRNCPWLDWRGHLMANPAASADPEACQVVQTPQGWDLVINCDTRWDDLPQSPAFAVKEVRIPVELPASVATGAVLPVSDERLSEAVYGLLACVAGIGSTSASGDELTALPQVSKEAGSVFGRVDYQFTLNGRVFAQHLATTGAGLEVVQDASGAEGFNLPAALPDALVGPCWPAIYAALGSAYLPDGFPVIEGLLQAVHLDHCVDFTADLRPFLAGEQTVQVQARTSPLEESASGRIVTVTLELRVAGELWAVLTERFAIRGRITTSAKPSSVGGFGGQGRQVVSAKRQFVRRTVVAAPAEMTPFALASGDFNPIHTSQRAAALVGLQAPLVHGMWLSATAQALVLAGAGHHDPRQLLGWTYSMYGMVQLGDLVELVVEQVGRGANGELALEVTAKIDDTVVSRGQALVAAPVTAYVYPGQGIQAVKMGAADRAANPVVRDVWAQADAHTRQAHGFSILRVVDENPTEMRVGGKLLRHPQGVLHLTQFTQVALAVLAYGQTRQLEAAGQLVPGSFFAGHSLGEYTALASCGRIFDLPAVIDVVYSRGSAMHSLVPRDEQGRSNYRLGALRPNQCGLGADQVEDFVAGIAEETGEFLQIVNYNVAGSQYAVAGTVAGLEALSQRASQLAEARGGKRPYIEIPGIDVPFHSKVLAPGVPAFAQTLERLLPEEVEVEVLAGRYLPNLVARPFELTRDFAQAILEVASAPKLAEMLADGDRFERLAQSEPGRLARVLLVELLSWQFASPVRWIETQALFFTPAAEGGLSVEELVEVGLAASPTLANLARRSLQLPGFDAQRVNVFNLEADAKQLLASEAVAAPPRSAELERLVALAQGAKQANAQLAEANSAAAADAVPATADTVPAVSQAAGASAVSTSAESGPAASTSAASAQAETPATPAAEPAPVTEAAPSAGNASSGPAPEAPFGAAQAARALFAWQTKLRADQIQDADTMDTLTNGVSSRRNQLLMDLAAELQVASIDGAAEAPVKVLLERVQQAAPTYRPLGPVLQAVVESQLRPLFASAGMKLAAVENRLRDQWALPESWVAPVQVALLLELREGESLRGGQLGAWPTAGNADTAQVNAWIDQAAAQVAAELGYQLQAPNAGGAGGGGGTVDAAAVAELQSALTGPDGVLARITRSAMKELGLNTDAPVVESDPQAAALLAAVERELGPKWLESVTPAFDANRAVVFNDRWASAREDLARVATSADDAQLPEPIRFAGLGEKVSEQAQWWAEQGGTHADWFSMVARLATQPPSEKYSDQVALVTGAAPGSIAEAVVADLLSGGATVIMTASRVNATRLDFARRLYADHASANAVLWLVPANLSAFADVDALVSWVTSVHSETAGQVTKILKPALLPTLLFPFAAPRVFGSLSQAGPQAERQARLLLWSVERLIAQAASALEQSGTNEPLHVVLPGSPNRGTFGGDGAYGETKAAFDALVNKWQVEAGWPQQVTLARAHIGWVAGTNLMGGNDGLVPAAQAAGVQVYTPQTIAKELLALCEPQMRAQAAKAPVEADLTGGLAEANLHLPTLAAQVAAEQAAQKAAQVARDEAAASASRAGQGALSGASAQSAQIAALPSWLGPTLAPSVPVGETTARLEDLVVLVGTGEVSAWGSGRTRLEAEYGIKRNGQVELTAAGVLELAWMMGLLTWAEDPEAGWYDQSGQLVPEAEIYDRYAAEVTARCGVREFVNDSTLVNLGSMDAETVYLEQDVEFTVPNEQTAQAYLEADASASYFPNEDGEFVVRKLAGTPVLVPRKATLTRTVGGQLPTDFDPAKWGLPVGMLDGMDRIAAWNLVTCVDAFLSAGFSPAELLQAVHPSQVASTQGTGIGGMESLRQVFLDRFLGKDRPQDVLQEALPNVVAAHVMQSFVGGYGAMIHPVAACATAAVSVEEAVDKIRVGKAQFVVAGGIDDISVESLTGFGDMNATADSAALAARGIEPRFFSRANDTRRAGFVEAAGGGTALLARGDLAARLGLPVLAVVAHAQSFADGAHTSIPAPGVGALAAGCGGAESMLARSLRSLGLSADDVRVISKHDTSTNANDPNESQLHASLWPALGRQAGNPQFVISQKSLTGHAKGGAALFQIAGLTEVLRSGRLPGNAALDCVDPLIQPKSGEFVWLREPLHLGSGAVKAAALTSLGFGHVSALVVLAHPSCFEAVLAASGQDVAAWRKRAQARLSAGARRLWQGMIGHQPLFVKVEERRLPVQGADVTERAMLLDADARLGAAGVYEREASAAQESAREGSAQQPASGGAR